MEHIILGDNLHHALHDISFPKFDMIDWQESTESTNHDCKLWADRGAVRALSISNRQTAGRGQSNRVWQSPKGNLYLSMLTDLPKPLDGRLALEVGLALVNMPILQNLALSVKWPNDLHAGDAKWGGILIEPIHSHNIEHGAIIGVGINLQPMQDMVSDRKVTDLTTLRGSELDHVQLVLAVVQAIQQAIDLFIQDCPKLPERFLDRDALANKAIQITRPEQPLLYARAVGISADGSLQISTVNGIEQLYSGQIKVMD